MEKVDGKLDWGQEGWDDFYVQQGVSWRDIDYYFLHRIFKLSTLEGNLLDVGCGLGDGLLFLKKVSRNVKTFIGLDISETAIETCQKKHSLQGMLFFKYNILKPLPESYDNIICLQTLEHLDDPHKAMHNLVSATRKVLIVGCPYLNRRLAKDHQWSFIESDFCDIVDSYCLDIRKQNIYWLVDKQKKGYKFHPETFYFYSELRRKLFYTLPKKMTYIYNKFVRSSS